MLWIQIGEPHIVAAWGGGTKEVGKYALHIDCSWKWEHNGNLIADQNSALNQLFSMLQSPVFFEKVSATDEGSLEVTLSDGSILTVAVDALDAEAAEEEMWRLFEPGIDVPHFVVGSSGKVM